MRTLRQVSIMLARILLAGVGAAALILLFSRLAVSLYARSRIFSPTAVPARAVAIVFGAGLWRDGSPTPVLQDRVTTAVDLYHAGKVKKLLLSGDNRFVDYNEPAAMKRIALSLGVPEEDIVLDYAGRRTYDTCYRAGAIFGVTQAVLVTQAFHLPRAVYTCNQLGVDAVGVRADRRAYPRVSRFYWNVRELFATLTALLDVHILHPLPVLGAPEPIPLDSQKVRHDS